MVCPRPMRPFLPTKSLIVAGIGFIGISALCVAQSTEKPSAGIPAPAQSSPPATKVAHGDAGYRIAGVIVSKTDGHPLVRARVAIADVTDRSKSDFVITSDDGKFEFSGLPAGKYSLSGQKRGFISATYDQHDQYSTAIVIGAELDTENLVLKLAPDAVLTGKVLDESGDPVRRATVTVYYNDHSQGVDRIRTYNTVRTDDLGVYEITPLRPGTYFVSASAKPWYATPAGPASTNSRTDGDEAARTVDPSLDVAYPLTYYPDVTDADGAMPIPIQGGERVQVDLHMTPVPSLRLVIHVSGEDKNRFAVPSIEASALDGSVVIPPDSVRRSVDGWEITGIPAGRYNIRVQGQGTQGQLSGVDITKDAEQIDTTASATLSDVKISVQVQGEALPKQLTIGLRSGSRPIAMQQVDAKGEAELENVPAGKYELVIWSNAKRYSIAHAAAEGAEISGHTLTVTPGESPSVSVTLVGGNAEIQGIVKKAGKGVAGAMVVLVPRNSDGDRDLFRRDQSDMDGTFALHAVIPGSYTVLAIENGWDLDWSQPEVIAAYTKRGRKIEISGQVMQPLKLPEAIEVQSK
jgi:Carboxypeptidase regulatory-like domain